MSTEEEKRERGKYWKDYSQRLRVVVVQLVYEYFLAKEGHHDTIRALDPLCNPSLQQLLSTVTLWVTLMITLNAFNEFDRFKLRSQAENSMFLGVLAQVCLPCRGSDVVGSGAGRQRAALTRNELSHVAPPLTRVTDSDSRAAAGVRGHSIHMWEALPPTPI